MTDFSVRRPKGNGPFRIHGGDALNPIINSGPNSPAGFTPDSDIWQALMARSLTYAPAVSPNFFTQGNLKKKRKRRSGVPSRRVKQTRAGAGTASRPAYRDSGSSKHQRCLLGFFLSRRAHSRRRYSTRTTASHPGSFPSLSNSLARVLQPPVFNLLLPSSFARMGNGDEQVRRLRWCSAFACALLTFVVADGLFVDITYIESAVAKGAGQSHITTAAYLWASASFVHLCSVYISIHPSLSSI